MEQHVRLLARRQIGKSGWGGGALKGVEAIAVDAREADESALHPLAAHALDGIAPNALDMSDDAHARSLLGCAAYRIATNATPPDVPFSRWAYSTMSRFVLSTNASTSARSVCGTWNLSRVASR